MTQKLITAPSYLCAKTKRGKLARVKLRDVKRYAKDYVRMQWMMLHQDQPEDYVIATGVQYSVRQFIEWTTAELGMPLRWHGHGVNEVGYWHDKPIVKIDSRYFRPTEVETLLGDPSKAKQKLGWVPKITAQEMCKELVTHDVAQAKQGALLKSNGYLVTSK